MIELEKAFKLTKYSSDEGCLIVLRENQINYPEPQSVSE
jgi:hypothetical protein